MKPEPSASLANKLKLLTSADSQILTKLTEKFNQTSFRSPPYKQITSISEELFIKDSENITEVIIGMLLFHANSRYSVNEATDSLIGNFPSEDGNEISKLKDFIYSILSNESLFLAVKASIILNDNERILISSKLISNIRPVFTNSEPLKVIGTTLSHQLKIIYQDIGSDIKEIFFTLDLDDLDELKKCIDREKEKTSLISEIFEINNSLKIINKEN